VPSPGGQPALQAALRARACSGPVVVLGVGSTLRGDDAVGVLVARALMERPGRGVTAIDAGPAPENAAAAIRRLAPAHLVIVDCALLGLPPGAARVVDEAEVDGASFSTHGLPLSMLAGYLRAQVGCAVTFVGIQPGSMAEGEGVSPEAAAGVRMVADALRELLAPEA
jgi:hydrogenase 3 maturation protease